MGTSILVAALVVTTSAGASIPRPLVEKQEDVFYELWNEHFVWKFADLPTKGSVEKHRVPYSGYIYPDTAGGTSAALRKYDRAFNFGRTSAVSWEKHDTTAYKERAEGLLGLLGRRRVPDWYGHCNGWTAAAIRHAEPERAVRRSGIVFTPADIKALLAEIYMYNDTEILGGIDYKLDAGTFHAILANWLGRGMHPVGMDSDPTKEKWNYPIYSFASSYARRSGNRVEVNTNILYSKDTEDGEYQESPRLHGLKRFHYMLQLDHRGRIIGGEFLRGSAHIDFVWVPVMPVQGGQDGNERGNPHVHVRSVLALWRASVPKETRQRWVTVAPPLEDRVVAVDEDRELLPRYVKNIGPLSSDEEDATSERVREVPEPEPEPEPERDLDVAGPDGDDTGVGDEQPDFVIEETPSDDPVDAGPIVVHIGDDVPFTRPQREARGFGG